jgi:hypothetical protein
VSLANYTDLTAAISSWTGRTDITPDVVTLFEAWANRKLRVRAMEALASVSMSIAVTGAANNGVGLVRLTITSTTGFSTGDIRVVQNVAGTTEANGTWTITVIDATHIDLQGTAFVNTYISGGGVVIGSGALPSDFLGWKMVRWPGNSTTGTDLRVLDYVHPAWFNAAYPTSPTDVPRVFTIENSTLYVNPADGSTLTLLYYQTIPALATSTTNWLMTEHPDFYLAGCMLEASAFMMEGEKAVLWKTKRDELFDEIQTADEDMEGGLSVRVMGVVV